MKCLCPDCSNQIQLNEPSSTEKGGFASCPECHAKIWLNKEPFVLRGYKKDWKIFCECCGDEVGADFFCQSCFASYPDYWVVQKNKPVKSVAKKQGFSFEIRPKVKKTQITISHRESVPSEKSKEKFLSRNLVVISGCLMLLVAGIVGYIAYSQYSQNKAFTEAYVKTLVMIKTSENLVSKKIETAVRQKIPLSNQEVAQLNNSKNEVDMVKGWIQTDSSANDELMNRLDVYYKAYNGIFVFAVSSIGTEENLDAQFQERREQFQTAEASLKAGLTENIREELRGKVTQFRKLEVFIN